MPQIPNPINGVTVEFAPAVTNDATDRLIESLRHTIVPNVATGRVLSRIWLSSVRDQHVCPSRHVTGNALDLSRINGKHIGAGYGSDAEVTAIVRALQERFETYQHRRENFGPHANLKEGLPHQPPDPHNDHIHFSVNNPHNCPPAPFSEANIARRAEVCMGLGDGSDQ